MVVQNIEFDDDPLLQEYQYALLCALKDPQRELNSACRVVGERFGGKEIKIRDMKEFASQFTAFLKDYLKMAEGVSVEYDEDNHVLTIHIDGCIFCAANTKFKLEKKQSAVCPLGGLLRGALEHIDGKIKSFRWINTEKPPGTLGICATTYEVIIE